MTKIASIYWVVTAINIIKRLPSISTGISSANGGASQPSGNGALLYLNVTLKKITYCNFHYPNNTLASTTPGNSLYPHLTFSVTTRTGIISPSYSNLTANTRIWTCHLNSSLKQANTNIS